MSEFSVMLNPDFQLDFRGTSSHFSSWNWAASEGSSTISFSSLWTLRGKQQRLKVLPVSHTATGRRSRGCSVTVGLQKKKGGAHTSLSFSVIITTVIPCRHGEKNKAIPSPCFLFSTCFSSATCQRQSSRRVEQGVGEGWGQEGGAERGLWQRDKQLERGGGAGGGGDAKKREDERLVV